MPKLAAHQRAVVSSAPAKRGWPAILLTYAGGVGLLFWMSGD